MNLNISTICLWITKKAWKKELELVQKSSIFEYPYGRSWFLRLSIDLNIWCTRYTAELSKEFKDLRDYIANDLFERVTREDIDFMRKEYSNKPWAAIQLYDYYTYFKNDENKKKISDVVNRAITRNPKLGLKFSDDIDNTSFFSLASNAFYCIKLTQEKEVFNKYLNNNMESFDYMTPIIVREVVHHLATNWSRAWGLVYLNLHKEYYDHIITGYEIHKKIIMEKKFLQYDSYYAYDHWVPQFMVYVLTFE